ncbi:hypothetical protein mRhiFer1_010093 [Rhinolophus ferrumequinum]|uniref:Uncharacterized protein n=1 Tax=Rhinolophus ferrumequinum TaxID=59479 RepID=A0A7J7XPJ7_RHIFE|nr:hypothetical protein mRhiFer1_010093 [Rhinolophus ferrumequinum]
MCISLKVERQVCALSGVEQLSQEQGEVRKPRDLQDKGDGGDPRAMTGQLLPVGICPVWFHTDLEVGGRHRAGIECEETEIDATSKREVSRQPVLVFTRGLVGLWLWTCVSDPAPSDCPSVLGNATGDSLAPIAL